MENKEWLAVFDFDKTLSTSDRNVLKKTILEMHRAKQTGAKVMICSARALEYLKRISNELIGHDIVDFVSGCNGAFGYDIKKDEFIWKKSIGKKQLDELFKMAEEYDMIPEVMTIEREITDKRLEEERQEEPLHARLGIPYWIVDNLEEDINKLYKEGHEFGLFAVTGREGQDLSEFVREIRPKMPELEFIKPSEDGPIGYVDITPKGVTKAMALKKAGEYYRINADRTVAFGDGTNDIPMFQAAGTTISMKNAHPFLKENATFVTQRDNNNDGVAQGIVAATVIMRSDLIKKGHKLKSEKRNKPEYAKQVKNTGEQR